MSYNVNSYLANNNKELPFSQGYAIKEFLKASGGSLVDAGEVLLSNEHHGFFQRHEDFEGLTGYSVIWIKVHFSNGIFTFIVWDKGDLLQIIAKQDHTGIDVSTDHVTRDEAVLLMSILKTVLDIPLPSPPVTYKLKNRNPSKN